MKSDYILMKMEAINLFIVFYLSHYLFHLQMRWRNIFFWSVWTSSRLIICFLFRFKYFSISIIFLSKILYIDSMYIIIKFLSLSHSLTLLLCPGFASWKFEMRWERLKRKRNEKKSNQLRSKFTIMLINSQNVYAPTFGIVLNVFCPEGVYCG